jgi:hypothetical protein
MHTTSVPSQTSIRIRPGTKARLEKFKKEHSVVPLGMVIDRALNFFLDYAEQGVDGNLNPIKKTKI